MAQPYTVTGGTSIVLISTLQSPNTVILLSSIQYPGHIVGIRDITGSNEIAQTPVIISTISSLKFYDGTSSVLLNKPNGFLTLSSRDPSTWQLLNSVGFLTTLSTGFLETLTTQRVFVLTTSSIEAYASSVTVANVNISKSFEVLGNTNIEGNIQIGGTFNVFSTLHAFQNVNLSSGLEVQGDVSFASSLFIKDALTVGSNLSTFQNATITDDLVVDGNFNGPDVLRPIYMPYLSVQTLRVSTMNVGGGIQLYGGISTKSLDFFSSLIALGGATIRGNTTVAQSSIVLSSLSVEKSLTTSTFVVYGDSAIGKTVEAKDFVALDGISTLEFVSVSKNSQFGSAVAVSGPVYVADSVTFQNMFVYASSAVSSVVTSTLLVAGYVSSSSSTFLTSKDLNALSNFFLGGDLIAGGRGAPFVSSYFSNVSFVSSLAVVDFVSVGGLFHVASSGVVSGNVTGITNLTVNGTLSTLRLESVDSLFVVGNLSVGQAAYVSTLGAPIDLEISTLSLSNALTINVSAKIPLLEVGQNAEKMAAGSNFTGRGGYDIYVDGILRNRSTVSQTNTLQPLKRWTANHLETSTLIGFSNLSSSVIGPAEFIYPFNKTPYTGLILGGSNLLGGANLVFASNASTTFYPCEPASLLTTFFPKRVRFNGSTWVAVGSNSIFGGPSIVYSSNGYDWIAATGASIPLFNDVVYGGGKWVAVGSNPNPSGASIYNSVNGASWSAASSGSFSNPGYATAVAYNGSNRWVAAGSTGSAGAVKWSLNGSVWNDSSIFSMFGEQKYTAVVWTGTNFITYSPFLAGPQGALSYQSPDGLFFSQLYSLFQFDVNYAGFGGDFSNQQPGSMTVGSNLGGNPLQTIRFALGLNFNVYSNVGVFTSNGNDVFYDSNTSNWLAAGVNQDFQNTVAYSLDGFVWQTSMGMPGIGTTICPGVLTTPSFFPYFTPNVTSIFHSTLSSQSITASTIVASSIQGSFFGDGSLVTGVTQYSEFLTVSSIQVHTRTNAATVSTLQTLVTKTQANDSIIVQSKSFFSTGLIYLAAGNDYSARGSIQLSADGSSWSRALTSNFEYYGNGVAGNGIATNAFFVAVGADSRPNYTIQWSRDGLVWNPVVQGGFSNPTEEGICEGVSVAYKDSVWVAVGVDPLGSNTIQYSPDGTKWFDAANGFSEYGTTVKASPPNFLDTKFVATGNVGMKYSSDGVTWLDTVITGSNPFTPTPRITAFGPGTYDYLGSTRTGWVAFDTNNLVYADDETTASGMVIASFTPIPGASIYDILWRSGTNWFAVGGTSLRTSGVISSWVVSSNFPVINLNTITYNAGVGKYLIGASASNANETIWTSADNGSNWSPLPSNNGFSTVVENYGQGFGIVSLGMSTFAVGKAAFSLETSIKPSILNLYTLSDTQISLTASNASNVFASVVRGIGATNSEIYKYVAVGDGILPQKTIARSQDGSPNSWIPAITGGFSTTGYAVTYFENKWIAVGDAQSSRNVIQYSPDGANWFGTNNAAALRSGGRAVAANTTTPKIVAAGKDTNNKTFAYSSDGFTWTPGTGAYFNRGANGVGFNGTATYVAVGEDTRGSSNTILRSTDGIDWSLTAAGGGLFSTTGYGVAYGNGTWVAVGEDPNPNNTILYSSNDGVFWYPVTSNGFTGGGYGITFNTSLNTFFAVGKDLNGDGPLTIKYSPDASNWNNISTGGFLSQKAIGSANGIVIQDLAATDLTPYMDFSKLVVYDRDTPFLLPQPSIRLSTTYIAFSEGLFVNLSSQVAVGENSPQGSAALTVGPYTTYVSSLIISGEPYLSSVGFFSSVIVSTLVTGPNPIALTTLLNPLETPSLAINVTSSITSNVTFESRFTHTNANDISPEIYFGSKYLHINDALLVKQQTGSLFVNQQNQIVVGPRDTNLYPVGGAVVNVNGTLGVSSLATATANTCNNFYLSAPRVFYKDDSLSMFGGNDPLLVSTGNRIYTTASSITFNSLMTLQLSTQKVGVFTDNPQFTLDVKGAGTLSTVQANTVNASLLFLTLQPLQF